MGQCYTVTIKLKNVDEAKLIEKTKEYFADADDKAQSWFVSTEKIIEFIGCKNIDNSGSDILVEKTEDGYEAEGDFDASYAWDDTMIEWFEACGSAIGDGSEIWVYPDEGAHMAKKADGIVTSDYYSKAELVDFNPEQTAIWNKIYQRFPHLSDDAIEWLKEGIADYDNDLVYYFEENEDMIEDYITEEEREAIEQLMEEES